MRYPPAGERENPYYIAAMWQKEDIVNIYFLKNLETGRYYGDELLPEFEQMFYTDYEVARSAAWFQNRRKDLTSLDKYVVEVKVMTCPIMYVRYGDDCLRRFFEVNDAIHFYEENSNAYEIGYFSKNDMHPVDLTRDWKWTPDWISCCYFSDSFWNSTFRGDFMEDPGKKFNAYYYEKTIYASTIGKISLHKNMFEQYRLKQALKENAVFLDSNGVLLTVKEEFPDLYYDFGGSYTAHYLSLWYPNGRLFGYTSLR